MDYKSHILLGIVFVISIALINNFFLKILPIPSLYVWLLYSPLIIIYTILPDIDHPASIVRGLVTTGIILIALYFLLIVNNKINAVIFLVILLVIWLLPHIKGFQHRGHLHSLVFALIFSIPIALRISWQLSIICFLAYFSHLLFDMEIKIW